MVGSALLYCIVGIGYVEGKRCPLVACRYLVLECKEQNFMFREEKVIRDQLFPVIRLLVK